MGSLGGAVLWCLAFGLGRDPGLQVVLNRCATGAALTTSFLIKLFSWAQGIILKMRNHST